VGGIDASLSWVKREAINTWWILLQTTFFNILAKATR